MTNLFIARHGEYSFDVNGSERLNDIGRDQLSILADAIAEVLSGRELTIVSSTAPRALDSSEHIRKILGSGEIHQIPYLWSGEESIEYGGSGRDPNFERVLKIFDSYMEKSKDVFFMTHNEIVLNISRMLGKREDIQIDYRRIDEGQAGHFDLKKRTYQVLPGIKAITKEGQNNYLPY